MYKQSSFEKKQSEAVLAHERKIINNMKTNPKAFQGYLNSKKSIKETISVLKNKDGKPTNSPKDVSNLLGNFFSSTFVSEPPGPLGEECYKQASAFISDLDIQADMVKSFLKKIN